MKKMLSISSPSHGHRVAPAANALLLAGLLLAGCAKTDVVARYSQSTFKAMLAALPTGVTWSTEEEAWLLVTPAGDEVLVSADFSRNGGQGGMADMDKPDIEFSLDAAPFLAAGLDPARLAGPEGIAYEFEEGRLMLHFELGSAPFSAAAKDSLEGTFAEFVRTERPRLGYHEKLDHYGIKLGGGNMLEWARDLSKNDKDLVLVLEPGPLVAAGLDPAKVAGWTFAKVEMKDESGKTVFVDKLLRPFNLK